MPPKQLRSLSICTCSAGIGDAGPSGCTQEFQSLRCALGRPVHRKRKAIAHELIQPCSTSTLGIDSQVGMVRRIGENAIIPQRTKASGPSLASPNCPMTAMASPTNMTSTDMIPELDNAAHDPRFWCLPPVRDESSEAGTGNSPMYLVTQGRSVGVWHNWTVVKAMVSRYPSGAQRGHHTMQGCIAEWQQHCALGVHPHPPEPKHAATTIRPIPGPQRNRGHVVEPALQMDLVGAGGAEPPERRYTVSVTRDGEAKEAFLKAEARGGKASGFVHGELRRGPGLFRGHILG
ncbi:hypothetical protein B0H14DRAFT_2642496 [Mycena olivaceomarginata]|nr:hypothetical protein B0H14DRAFT_2642496 [Mycena olivaceomarginata]